MRDLYTYFSFSPYPNGFAPWEASLLYWCRRIWVSVRRHSLKLAITHRLIGTGTSVGRRSVGLEELVVYEILDPGVCVATGRHHKWCRHGVHVWPILATIKTVLPILETTTLIPSSSLISRRVSGLMRRLTCVSGHLIAVLISSCGLSLLMLLLIRVLRLEIILPVDLIIVITRCALMTCYSFLLNHRIIVSIVIHLRYMLALPVVYCWADNAS